VGPLVTSDGPGPLRPSRNQGRPEVARPASGIEVAWQGPGRRTSRTRRSSALHLATGRGGAWGGTVAREAAPTRRTPPARSGGRWPRLHERRSMILLDVEKQRSFPPCWLAAPLNRSAGPIRSGQGAPGGAVGFICGRQPGGDLTCLSQKPNCRWRRSPRTVTVPFTGKAERKEARQDPFPGALSSRRGLPLSGVGSPKPSRPGVPIPLGQLQGRVRPRGPSTWWAEYRPAASADRSARKRDPARKEVPSLLKHPETRGISTPIRRYPGLQRVSMNKNSPRKALIPQGFFGVVRKVAHPILFGPPSGP